MTAACSVVARGWPIETGSKMVVVVDVARGIVVGTEAVIVVVLGVVVVVDGVVAVEM